MSSPMPKMGSATHSQAQRLGIDVSSPAQDELPPPPDPPPRGWLWPPRPQESRTDAEGWDESPSVLEEGRGDVTITTNSLNKQINSGQSSACGA